MAFT
jgi:hypothetical protein